MPRTSSLSLISSVLALALMHCESTQVSDPQEVGKWGGSPDVHYADIRFEGEGFQTFEGKTVLIRMGNPQTEGQTAERIVHAYAKVEGGRFQIDMQGVREVGLYKRFILLFDLDRDGRCDPGTDQGHVGATGAQDQPYVYDLDGNDKNGWPQVEPVSPSQCAYFDSLMP